MMQMTVNYEGLPRSVLLNETTSTKFLIDGLIDNVEKRSFIFLTRAYSAYMASMCELLNFFVSTRSNQLDGPNPTAF